MKRILTLTFIVLAATFASAQDSAPRTRFFINAGPTVGYFGDDFDTAFGGSVAVGIQLPNQQSIEFEAGYLSSEFDRYSAVDMTFAPLLGKYRFPFVINEKLSLSIAAVTGAVYQKAEGWYIDRDDAAFAIGAEAAIDYTVSGNVSIGAGVTSLYLTETDLTTDGGVALLNLRATFRF